MSFDILSTVKAVSAIPRGKKLIAIKAIIDNHSQSFTIIRNHQQSFTIIHNHSQSFTIIHNHSQSMAINDNHGKINRFLKQILQNNYRALTMKRVVASKNAFESIQCWLEGFWRAIRADNLLFMFYTVIGYGTVTLNQQWTTLGQDKYVDA